MIKGNCQLKESKEYLERKNVKKTTSTPLFNISKIGCGTYLGEPTSAVDAMYTESIKEAIETGVNFLDTAVNYRGMKSEILFGKLIKELVESGKIKREEFAIATKGGFITADYSDLDILPHDYKDTHRSNVINYFKDVIAKKANLSESDIEEVLTNYNCIKKEYIEWSFNQSQQNLGLETIDIFYLHNPSGYLKAVGEERFYNELKRTFAYLEEKVKENSLISYGIASYSEFIATADEKSSLSLEKIVNIAKEVGGENHHFKFIQLPYNKKMQDANDNKNQVVEGQNYSILDASKKLNISIITNISINQTDSLGKFTIDEMIEFLVEDKRVSSSLIGMKTKKYVAENLKNIL